MLLPRSYSHHSLLSALPQIPKLIKNAKEKGYTSIALTDEDSGSGLIEFYEACLKENIKPILGATLRIANKEGQEGGFGSKKNFSKIALLAKNKLGYGSLLKLISKSRTIREKPFYHLKIQDVKEEIDKGDNLFVLLAGNDHELIQNIRVGNLNDSEETIQRYLKNIPAKNLLVEAIYPLKDENLENWRQLNLNLKNLLDKHGIRMVLSPASRYLEKEDEEAFRVVLAIREQTKLAEINLIRDFDLPKVTDLQAQFDFLPDITGTQDLEDQIDIKLQTDYDKHADDAFFPKFKLPSEQQPGQRLIWEAYIGLATRLMPGTKTKQDWQQEYPYNKRLELKEFVAQITPDTSKLLGYPSSYWKEKSVKDYIDRVEYELEIIIQKGYSEYFLVFGDIMGFCRENGIVTNTRGSAAGSLVGYLTNINVLDPLIYDIPFERFLNPFRPSPPDIDGDFADDKRDLVINYIRDRYGDTKVSQIITFGTMLPRAAVRDVGRVLGISYKKCDRLSKLIPIAPQGKKTTFDFAFETSDEVREVYEKDEESRRIVDISRKIEGNYRHASSHAAGLLITPTELTDYAPLQWDSEHKMLVSQYDMKVCEKVGLVKLDILGITNLAILGNAIALTEQRRKIDIDILNIDVSDPKAFELLASGRTMGTFQLSGGAMTRYLVDLRPTRVEDLMAMVALYRPGPMANIPEFIKRKRNPKLAKYFVPKMKDWMEPTFGILVYQEDLLLTAIEVAGYDWGEADVLRKGMGKKIQAVIEGQHPKFVEGCISHGGLSREKAEEIWQAFLPFAAYGFNKAHSASYGMVAYWTAYMKAEYTVEFMTAYMTSESNNLDKIAAAIAECRELGVQVLPPDVNNSYDNFSIENDQIIRYGLKSVKNLGVDLIDYIISERNQSGKFDNIENFLERVGVRGLLTKRNVEALILSGALDSLGAKVLQES